MTEHGKAYVLLLDETATMDSVCEPFGVAVRTEKEAQDFIKCATQACTRGYHEVEIYSSWEEGVLNHYEKELFLRVQQNAK